MKSIITDKISLEGLSTHDQAEKISKPEDRSVEINYLRNVKKNEEKLTEAQRPMRYHHAIYTEKRKGRIFEKIMAQNFSYLMTSKSSTESQ